MGEHHLEKLEFCSIFRFAIPQNEYVGLNAGNTGTVIQHNTGTDTILFKYSDNCSPFSIRHGNGMRGRVTDVCVLTVVVCDFVAVTVGVVVVGDRGEDGRAFFVFKRKKLPRGVECKNIHATRAAHERICCCCYPLPLAHSSSFMPLFLSSNLVSVPVFPPVFPVPVFPTVSVPIHTICPYSYY